MASSRIPFYLAAGAIVIGLGAAVHGLQSSFHPAAEGRDYLQKRGYTEISGGERDYFNMCGKNTVARSYQATSPQGRAVTQTVCFRALFGPYLPLL